MPRKKRGFDDLLRPIDSVLASTLADELRQHRESGQPVIDEQRFPRSGSIRVIVLWDQWNDLSDIIRSETILNAYEQAEGLEYRDRIAVAVGLTFPEAIESGFLPFKVIPLLGQRDAVTLEQCREAMVQEGASILSRGHKPQLRFATIEEAKACLDRLVDRLPGSKPVWTIAQEVSQIVD